MAIRSCWALCLFLLLCRLGSAEVVVSEVVAENGPLGFKAADGSTFDWIELHNTGAGSVDLLGSYLTDDPAVLDKWRFDRSFVIPAGGFRVVFASDRNGLFDGQEHTNFKLNSGAGEFLALVDSDGATTLSEFAPAFPPLGQYVAYGRVSGGDTLGKLETATPNAANAPAAPEAKVLSFTSSHMTLPGGADLILTWTTENADRVELATAATLESSFVLIRAVVADDSVVFYPSRDSVYRIRAINAYGSHDAFVAVAVGPLIVQLEATPLTIASGGSTVVQWSARGSDLTLKLGGVAVTQQDGRQVLPLSGAPAADTVVPVTLTATNASGSVSETVNITVLAENAALPPLPPLVLSEFYWSYLGTFEIEPYRFLEIHNRGDAAVDLDGIQLAGSVYSQLSNARPSRLAADGYALIVADQFRFAEIWPGDRPVVALFGNSEPAGTFRFELDQFLLDSYGRVIEHVTADQPLFNATIFTPAQRIDEDAPPVFPDNWKVSEHNQDGAGPGTPGEANFEILEFSADPPSASPGETVTIRWETSRDALLSISNGIGAVSEPAGNTTYTIPPNATKVEFTLTAHTSFTTFQQTLRVSLPPTIRSFWSTKTAISRGDEITLHWNLKSVNLLSSLRIDPEVGHANTPLTFTPLIQGFPVASLWRYLPNGNGQGPEWRDPGFDDRRWRYGRGIFGYGNDIEETVIERGEWITAYFRRHFDADELDQVESLAVDLLIDDGAEVYLNGTEVLRVQLPAGEIDFNTQSDGVSPNDGREYRSFDIDPAALVAGDNVIAVGAHNNIPNAADFGFDLGLRAVKAIPPDGRKNYTLSASNPAGTASATVTILFEEKTRLANWLATHGLAGDPTVTDTDRDGLTDLVEFATGSDPLADSPPPISVGIDADGKLLVRFPRHLSRANVLLRAETSTDLQAWQGLEDAFVFEDGVAPPGSSLAECVHRWYAPAQGRRYLRLAVSLIP